MSTQKVSVLATATQVQRPWRTTVRTVFQGLVALAAIVPLLVLEVPTEGLLASVVAVAATITRIMAIPQVEDWLIKFIPFLAAEPVTYKQVKVLQDNVPASTGEIYLPGNIETYEAKHKA